VRYASEGLLAARASMAVRAGNAYMVGAGAPLRNASSAYIGQRPGQAYILQEISSKGPCRVRTKMSGPMISCPAGISDHSRCQLIMLCQLAKPKRNVYVNRVALLAIAIASKCFQFSCSKRRHFVSTCVCNMYTNS
jgi:hypothetical protein